MNPIQLFNNPQFGTIRTMKTENEEPMFCLLDIARVLGYSRPADAVTAHCDKGVRFFPTPTKGGTQNLKYGSEGCVYRLVMASKLPEAVQFQDWICDTVIPSLRKNGGYIATKPEDTAETILARAVLLANATLKALEVKNKLLESCNQDNVKKLEEQAPKVLFADSVATSDKSILIGEMAKILCQNGYEIGQNRLFEKLRTHGYLCSRGDSYNKPSQKSLDMSLFEVRKFSRIGSNGTIIVESTPVVTGKGQLYFVNKFLAKVTQEA